MVDDRAPLPQTSLADVNEGALRAFVRSLPKAELHIHVEGSLEPEMVFAKAAKHGITLPYADVDALRAAYSFHNLQSFLDIYYSGVDVLRDAQDFHDLMYAYLLRAHEDGVVYSEVFFDPQSHTSRGLAFATVMGGLLSGLEQARRELGVRAELIMCFLRHLDAQDAMATLEQALPWKSHILAVGLDSSELGHPPAKFAAVFARAREQGWPCVAHAGEEGPASYIVEALDVLHVQRIDHGVRVQEDPALMHRLARQGTALTVCPLSNVRLGVFPHLREHNLKRLMDAGLCITINSDDPAYFGGYVAENYVQTAVALGLSRTELVELARNSIQASLLAEPLKLGWLDQLDRIDLQAGGG